MALAQATRYTPARAPLNPGRTAPVSSKRPHLFIPKAGALVGVREFFWRELREGGQLKKMFDRERDERATTARYRRVARATEGFQQNNRSDVRKVASIPVEDFMRWLHTDPDFFADDKNLRSLRRDNPDARVYL